MLKGEVSACPQCWVVERRGLVTGLWVDANVSCSQYLRSGSSPHESTRKREWGTQRCRCTSELVSWVSLHKAPEVESLRHKADLLLIFWGNCMLFCFVATPICMPVCSAWGYFSTSLSTLVICRFIDASRCQAMEETQVPINRWVDKNVVIYTHTMEYYLAIKKNKILPFAIAWMDLKGIMLSETSQSEKDK